MQISYLVTASSRADPRALDDVLGPRYFEYGLRYLELL